MGLAFGNLRQFPFFNSSHAGYDSSVTIKGIQCDDFKEFERIAQSIPKTIKTFIKEAKITANAEQINTIQRLFLGFCSADSFKFRKGDVVLTLEIAQFVRSKFECAKNSTRDGFSFFETGRVLQQRTPTVKTLVGELFCDKASTTDNQDNINKKACGRGKVSTKHVGPKSIVPTAYTNQGSSSSTDSMAANREVIDMISAKSILIDSCSQQVKSALRETFRTNSFEETFMNKCGFESLAALTVDINFDESDLQCYLGAGNDKSLKAIIACYCGDETKPATAAAYFRANSTWSSLTPENISSQSSMELAKCWNIGNFKRHLKSHKKKFETSCKFLYKQISYLYSKNY